MLPFLLSVRSLRNELEFLVTVVRAVRLCPIRCVFALAVLCGAAAGCKATRSPIFEWAPPSPVSGISPAGQGGSLGGAVADGGRAGSEQVGDAAGEMRGESGSGGDAQVDQHSTFVWGQTLPGSCRGQNFVGTFSCNVQNAIPNTRIDGTLLVDFAAPSEAQALDVQNSSLNLLTDPVNNASLMTPVTGKATCSTKLFKGEVPQTVFTAEQVGAGFQLVIGLFCGSGAMGGTVSGTLLGQLDGGTLYGQMALTIGTCTCEGPFNLRAQ